MWPRSWMRIVKRSENLQQLVRSFKNQWNIHDTHSEETLASKQLSNPLPRYHSAWFTAAIPWLLAWRSTANALKIIAPQEYLLHWCSVHRKTSYGKAKRVSRRSTHTFLFMLNLISLWRMTYVTVYKTFASKWHAQKRPHFSMCALCMRPFEQKPRWWPKQKLYVNQCHLNMASC